MPKSALREVIDAYRESPSEEAFERMFERDKDELRGMGGAAVKNPNRPVDTRRLYTLF